MRDPFVDKLKAFIEPIYFCPEMALGLGVPRAKIRIVIQDGKKKLVQPESGRDLTEKMEALIDGYISSLEEIEGALLKSKSPSCGVGSAKFFKGETYLKRGNGFLAEALKKRWPSLPLTDEGLLRDRSIRYHFLSSIFSLAEFRIVKEAKNPSHLVEFHTKHKFLLKTFHEPLFKELGQIVAHGTKTLEEKINLYQERLYRCLSYKPSRSRHVNTLYHLAGYFTKRISQREKNHLIGLIEKFRHGRVDLITVLEVLRGLAFRFEEEYILKQRYLNPFPDELF